MLEDLKKEINYRTSRSGGAGGQHVNKVSTKVELIFDVEQSEVLSDKQKEIIYKKLENRITKDGLLIMQCEETRSQLKNKEIVFERFITQLTIALKPEKERKPTRPTRSSVIRRIKDKKKKSEKKENRKPPEK